MPKIKTRKAVSSKFRLTATGKLKRGRPGKRHILTKKSSKRKRQMCQPGLVSTAQEKMYKRAMCV